jgi:hypothetical protein
MLVRFMLCFALLMTLIEEYFSEHFWVVWKQRDTCKSWFQLQWQGLHLLRSILSQVVTCAF